MDALAALLAAAWWFPYAVGLSLLLATIQVFGVLILLARRAGTVDRIAVEVAAIRRTGIPTAPPPAADRTHHQ